MTEEVPPPRRGRWTLLAPMLVVQIYLWFTVGLFAWGPWDWQINNPWTLYGYLTIAHAALLLGYLAGIRAPGKAYKGHTSIATLVKLGTAVALLMFIPTSYTRTGNFLPDVIEGLNSPGTAYDNLRLTASQTPYVEYMRSLLGPLLVLPVPLGIFYWRRISKLQRIGVVAVAGSTVALFVAMGTNKAIADIMLLVPWLILASLAARRVKISRRAAIRMIGGTAIGVGMFFSFFSLGMTTRGGGASSVVNGVLSHVGVRADYEHTMLDGLSQESKVGVVGLSMYLGVGYKGLSMCLEEPWVPTWGVGHSFFLTRQTERILGMDDLWKNTYPARIEYLGWDSLGLWSSIYPWLASDLSFPGSIVAVFLVGLLFAKVWRDVLIGSNPFAIVLLSQVVLMLFYFPANNQVLQFGEGLTGFFVILIAWQRTRGRTAES